MTSILANFRPGLLGQRLIAGCRQASITVLAAFIAYTPAHLIGLNQAFWGAITAIAVAQVKFADTEAIARKQFTGAAIGGLVALCLIESCGEAIWVYALAVVLAVIACWLLNVGDASQLAGITATIVLLVPHVGSPERMMASRLSEVTWGVIVAIAIVWVEDRLTRPQSKPTS